MIKNSINVMHISDIHCGVDDKKPPKYCLERAQTIQAFHRDFNEIPPEWKPDVIAISGDIGWTGCEEDYNKFQDFLQELLTESGLSSEDVVCCAGNHDKYLPKEYKLSDKIKGKSNFHLVDDVYSNLNVFSDNFKAYSENLRNMRIEPLINNSEVELSKYLYGYRVVKGLRFVVLNSAWLCDWRKDERQPDADKNNLLLDVNIVCQIARMIDSLPPLPTIVMYHHPKDWLKNSEIYNLNGADKFTTVGYVDNMAHITLNGHTHVLMDEHSRQKLCYTAGTVSSEDTYKSECRLLRIYVNNRDINLSRVQEGRYHAKWINGQVSWKFETNSELLPFDERAYRNIMSDLLTEMAGIIIAESRDENKIQNIISEMDILGIFKEVTTGVYIDASYDAEKNETTKTLQKTLNNSLRHEGTTEQKDNS